MSTTESDKELQAQLRGLLQKLDPTCTEAVQGAMRLAVGRTHYEIEVEHLLYALNESPDNDLDKILRYFEVSSDRLQKGLTQNLDELRRGSGRRSAGLSYKLVRSLKAAWVLCSTELGLERIRAGAWVLAMLEDADIHNNIRAHCPDIDKIDTGKLKVEFGKIVGEAGAPSGAPGEDGSPLARKVGGKTPSLDQFTTDLVAEAKAGRVDPVLGRDDEVRQIIDILLRRRQNNPILTGEAGVGKTAVVEGFALKIAAGHVPPALKDVSVRSLDLALLQAGAGMKGEFENRLKGVIKEVKDQGNVILFIDEAHTMIGAGGQQGQGDAANLLKPALARGELRTIAATTWAEYKKYFEKDAALARRFQVVKVEEPTEELATEIMRGVAEMLEQHHGVAILDEAIEASVHLSARYITGRQLPDKCVSLLDTACARISLGQAAEPAPIEDAKRQIVMLESEQRILSAEQATGIDHQERLDEIAETLETTRKTLEELESRLAQEKELVEQIREVRNELRIAAGLQPVGAPAEDGEPAAEGKDGKPVGSGGGSAPVGTQEKPELTDEQKAELKARFLELTEQLKSMQGEQPLMEPCVTEQTIAEVIHGWTGIPVGRMMADEIKTTLKLKDLMAERVVGQDHALETISRRIQISKANLEDPKKPIGVFLLVGPSGVGKTETALALADLFYGGEHNMVTINMSEYQEAHTVSGLKGSPPGYVGYGEGGRLTEAVRRKPYSVVLLDEVEKAHPDVMQLFFQVFDKGTLEDGEGRQIDFKNTVILLTSNAGTDTIMELCADPENRPDAEEMIAAVHQDLLKHFPPALLGRTVSSVYYPLSEQVKRDITRLKLNKIVRRVKSNQAVLLDYTDDLVDAVVARCTDDSAGARNIDNVLTNTVLPELSRSFLEQMAEGRVVEKIHVGTDGDGGFTYSFE